jgi:hypothetical protein
MARNPILLVAILAAGMFAASMAQANQLQAWAQVDARVAWHSDNPQPGSDHQFNWFALGMTIAEDEKYFEEAFTAIRQEETPDAISVPAVVSDNNVAPVEPLPSTNVVSVITSNRWSGDALIVSGTLTNTSTVVVLITGIDAKGFNQDQKMVIEGSDFTIVHNDLAPGQVVNFKVALKDGTKQVRFVKVLPSWFSP